MNYKLIMNTAVLAGEIMLSSGAETYRVEDTMCHILRTSKCEKIEAFALMTGIVTTLDDEKLLVVCNFSDHEVEYKVPEEFKGSECLITNIEGFVLSDMVPAYGAFVLKK